MRLLVVSHAFPPFNTIGGVRVGKTVKYLLRFGHDVRVLTARDQPASPTLRVEAPEAKIIRTRSLNVRRPAEVALGKGARAAAENRAPRGGRLGAALKEALAYPLRTVLYFPDANVGWMPYAVSEGGRLFRGWKPELILASSPPPTSLLVARGLARTAGVPWVAELRDLWVDQHYYRQPFWRRAAERRLERRVLSSAAGLVTVSEPLAETLRARYGKPAAVVTNGFDPSDYPADAAVPYDEGRIRILYTGVTFAGRQDPTPLFEALKLLGPLAEGVRVSFYGSYLVPVAEAAERCGVSDLVEINAPVPYEQSLRMQRESDILLLLLWTDPAQRGIYTGKLFEYTGARRPVLAVGRGGDVASEFVRARGVGVVADDPARIAEQLRAWLREKQETGAVAPPPEGAAAGVSREEQTRVLESYLFDVLRRAGGARASA